MLSPNASYVRVISLIFAGTMASGLAEDGIEFFESKVRPILVSRCYECHSEEAGKQKGGLWLDRRAGWQEGGDGGPTLVPSEPKNSLLVHSIHYLDEDLQMPPRAKLPVEEIEILERWVAMGAPDPRDEELTGALRKEEIDFAAAREQWAFRKHQNPPVPKGEKRDWARNDVDRFLLRALEAKGQAPAEDATPEALLRRVSFDLTGLPPSPGEMDAFLADPTPDAFAAIVDDLLSRPAFGEKWGRHWLDVARYADSNGGDRNFTFFQAWRYRNYVIDSFNADRSYYDFVRQQLAGDLMDAEDPQERRDQLIASTFLALGPKMLTERDKEKLRLDTADEQVDTVGRALLGLTMGCARCHDHKFDPISQKDYYAVAGIFRSTQVVMGTRNGCVNVASWVEQPLPVADAEDAASLKEKVDRLELAMRLVVEKSFMKKAGGKMAADKLPLAGVIYDDTDAERVGEWKESTYLPTRFGASYLHDDKQGKGEKKVVFRGSLPENGIYEVRVAYNADDRRARKVPITVEAWKDTARVTLDQTKTPEVGGLFQPIGRFHFEKGGRVNVVIETGGTDGYVIVDAVQFIAEKDIEREAEAIAAVSRGKEGELFQMSEGDLKKEMSKLLTDLRDEEVAMAPRDADDSGDIHLRVRGEVGQLGALVPRGFPQALHAGAAPAILEGQSGRLQFADWITGPENALLDRVIVNRIWHHLFGRGIVGTPDNFGTLGAEPTHPELLDHLAKQFRESGGSMKSMVRELVLSRAYQLSADAPEALAESDPENTLFGRQNRRRLTAEEIRDGVLFLAGKLDSVPGQATAGKYGEDLDKPMNFAEDTRRTVYLPVARNNEVPELVMFDAANPDLVSGSRATTTVPTQALYLLNSDFFQDQAREVGRMARAAGDSPSDSIGWMYRRILNREASPAEIERALGFLDEIGGDAESGTAADEAMGHFAHLLVASTEFLFLD